LLLEPADTEGGPARPRRRRALVCLVLACLTFSGCSNQEGTIDVDLSVSPPRFIIEHQGWPRPFWWPRVTEFAIGSNEDDLLWQLQAADDFGELACGLAFVYGQVPAGWQQVFPAEGARPKPLAAGRSYYVGAGGPKSVYRVVFALPLSMEEAAERRRSSPVPGKNDGGENEADWGIRQ